MTMAANRSQAWIFQKLRWTLVRNARRQLFGGSRIKLVSIALCSIIVFGTVGAASWEAFHLLAAKDIPFAGGIIGVLFDFLFLSLSVMLFFSSGIIVFGSLFGSPETAYLLTTPVRADYVFAYKFQTAMAFSSWAFLLLGCPILFAYGVVYAVSWHFFALLPFLLLGFVLLPGSLGSITCFLIVNFLPHRRRQVLTLTLLLITVGAVAWAVFVAWDTRQLLTGAASRREVHDALQDIFGQFEFARSKFAPSHWMTEALLATARGDLQSATAPVALIWSNGLFAYLIATVIARRFYRRGFNRIATGGNLRKRYGGGWMDRTITGVLRFLDPQTRLLIVKDFRTFRRDPAQWAQVLIFIGLVFLYVINSRLFFQAGINIKFAHGVSLMNVGATALLMCAFMGRFIFPLMSLEGKKFWILGLLPLRRDRLLWGKFYFAASGSLLVAIWLVLVGDLLLGLDLFSICLHMVTVLTLALGLSGLSVGLGAAMPNFRESDPSKIAVGFGGTLNLIAGLMYLLLVIGLISAPYHVMLMIRTEDELPGRLLIVVIALAAVGIGAGLQAPYLALRLGVRTLRKMEF
jgi:ABC-2 type transport system permease protein